jgi:hypothetical protein
VEAPVNQRLPFMIAGFPNADCAPVPQDSLCVGTPQAEKKKGRLATAFLFAGGITGLCRYW